MNWGEFERSAPELAHQGRERFERTHVALLGTLRSDGSPRISPIQPYLLGDRLVIGVMGSPKAQDLARDGRCTLHSSVSDVDGSEGEFKLHGKALPIREAELEGQDAEAWWKDSAAGSFALYTMDIQSATFVSWDTLTGRLSVMSWSLAAGPREMTRDYP